MDDFFTNRLNIFMHSYIPTQNVQISERSMYKKAMSLCALILNQCILGPWSLLELKGYVEATLFMSRFKSEFNSFDLTDPNKRPLCKLQVLVFEDDGSDYISYREEKLSMPPHILFTKDYNSDGVISALDPLRKMHEV